MEVRLLQLATPASQADGIGATIDLSDKIFGRRFAEPLVHQVVEAYRAAGRSGTKAQKSRSEVRGGGIKPWRQKGTGKARVGTIRSPLWRGGGVTFAAKPRDFVQKVNKKMYRGAICSILSELLREERLVVVDSIETTGKTRDLVRQLAMFNFHSILIITEQFMPSLYLAARNLPQVEVGDLGSVNPLNLIGFDGIIFTVAALKKIEEMLVA